MDCELNKDCKEKLKQTLDYLNGLLEAYKMDLKFFHVDKSNIVVETIKMPDGSLKNFTWRSDEIDNILYNIKHTPFKK